MNYRMKNLRSVAFLAPALLLSLSAGAQTAASGDNKTGVSFQPTPVEVFTVMPPVAPKASPLHSIPVPAEAGNREAEVSAFAEEATRWAAENPDAYANLDQELKNLFDQGRFELLMSKIRNFQNANSK